MTYIAKVSIEVWIERWSSRHCSTTMTRIDHYKTIGIISGSGNRVCGLRWWRGTRFLRFEKWKHSGCVLCCVLLYTGKSLACECSGATTIAKLHLSITQTSRKTDKLDERMLDNKAILRSYFYANTFEILLLCTKTATKVEQKKNNNMYDSSIDYIVCFLAYVSTYE